MASSYLGAYGYGRGRLPGLGALYSRIKRSRVWSRFAGIGRYHPTIRSRRSLWRYMRNRGGYRRRRLYGRRRYSLKNRFFSGPTRLGTRRPKKTMRVRHNVPDTRVDGEYCGQAMDQVGTVDQNNQDPYAIMFGPGCQWYTASEASGMAAAWPVEGYVDSTGNADSVAQPIDVKDCTYRIRIKRGHTAVACRVFIFQPTEDLHNITGWSNNQAPTWTQIFTHRRVDSFRHEDPPFKYRVLLDKSFHLGSDNMTIPSTQYKDEVSVTVNGAQGKMEPTYNNGAFSQDRQKGGTVFGFIVFETQLEVVPTVNRPEIDVQRKIIWRSLPGHTTNT